MEDRKASKAKKFRLLIVLAIVAALSLGAYMHQGNTVFLNIDGKAVEVVSHAKSVGELIEREEINFESGAYINVSLDTNLDEDINIIIKNPKPYTIKVGNASMDISSSYSSVGEILKDKAIALDEDDFTYPELSSKVSPLTTIEVFYVDEIAETQDTVIPFEEQVITSKDLERGKKEVVQEGKDGVRRSHIKKRYINGVLDSSIIVKDEIVAEPVTRVVKKGTMDFVATSRGNTRYRKAVTMTATAYDLSFKSTGKRPGDKYYGITASGTRVRPGVVAVDPKVIPLGTKLYVQSLDGTRDYGFAIAEDTGGAIKGNKIDLFFESTSDVYKFGRRKVKVYILD